MIQKQLFKFYINEAWTFNAIFGFLAFVVKYLLIKYISKDFQNVITTIMMVSNHHVVN